MTPIGRRAFALSGASMLLSVTGCAVESAPPRVPSAAAQGLLTPWLSLTGGWRLDPASLPFVPARPGPRLDFRQPVGVAAQGDVVLVADAGARTIWRLERSRDAMAAHAAFTGSGSGQGASLQLDNDFTSWLAMPAEHAVVQLDARGQTLRRWRDDGNAPRPVAVAVPLDRGEIFVADAISAQIVVFHPMGGTMRILRGGEIGALQSVSAMTFGPRGLYVLDRLAQQVVVFERQGRVVEVIGDNQLVLPRALAVDRGGRVFVSDDVDQTIKVFRGKQLLATVGGSGAGPGRFGRIEAMAIDGNLLYVADSLNGRVQIMLVAPASMDPLGAPQ